MLSRLPSFRAVAKVYIFLRISEDMPPKRGPIERTIHETTELAGETAGIAGFIILAIVILIVGGFLWYGESTLLAFRDD